MRLEGKVAIITGGANGMGAEECRILSREGAKVVIADVMEDEGRQVEAEIAESGGDAVFMRLDVTDEDNWNAVVADTVARFGKLDILVNNAGISGSHNPDTMSTEAWDTFMDIN
ncbi:MAG: SDR family NAD(P)-dependent oxidoreductase, partial [Chloroflexi bacterium]|nr:SDR family NAD(P)-dependent oxidoreductase [Chloroflexota bacterium]